MKEMSPEFWEQIEVIGAILAFIGVAGIIFPGLSIYKTVTDVTHDETMESDTKEINILKKIIYGAVGVFLPGAVTWGYAHFVKLPEIQLQQPHEDIILHIDTEDMGLECY